MSLLRTICEAILVTLFIVLCGGIWIDRGFADRIPYHVRVGLFPLSGLETSQVLAALDAYEQEFLQTKVTIIFRDIRSTRTFADLGIELQKEQTAKRIRALAGSNFHFQKRYVVPSIVFHNEIAQRVLQQDFGRVMVVPKNPTLALGVNNTIQVLPAKEGESIDMVALNHDISEVFARFPMKAIHASSLRATSRVSAAEVERVRLFAEHLLLTGFRFTALEQTFEVPLSVVAGMIQFTSDITPTVQFDERKLREYIAGSIVPNVEQSPVNARFQVTDGRVNQFALPRDGRTVNIDETIRSTAEALALHHPTSSVSVQIVRPLIASAGDSEKLGITQLLAVGESDFKGSPKNRTKNIEVGTSRYNGILIAPNEEFSFNAILGPVNKEAGYLPELVIKNHTTTPEYGGGLCQVSSTVFRAAVNSGMKITSRRNHAYAVRYYGTPGFDATIYPPYTDFRFLNNTPGYILIQTKIEGTKLSFEFWGTGDNRTVTLDGPNPYGRKPDGSVKSVLKQTVIKDGQPIIEDTFYSNYKSPNLFPHT